MSRTQQRWTLFILFIFAVVLAACQPSATPTPTTRPTATTVPPTTAAAAATSESASGTAESTAEATKAPLSLDATLAPFVAQSPTPASASATTEATEMTSAATAESTESIPAVTTEATQMTSAATAEMTAMVSPATAEMTMAPTEEMTEMMSSPTAEMTMEATSEMTMEATSTMEATAELGTIIDVAKADGNFTTLLAAIDKADLTDTLNGAGPFTVFAPTDDAFKALLASTKMTAADLLSNPDLVKILEYHVVAGKVTADDLQEYKSKDNPDLIIVPTMDGKETLTLRVADDGTITINGVAKVTLKNVMASNGVIHVIDAVLMPPTAEATATAEATVSS